MRLGAVIASLVIAVSSPAMTRADNLDFDTDFCGSVAVVDCGSGTAQRDSTGFASLSRTANRRATAGVRESLARRNTFHNSFAAPRAFEAGNVFAYLDQLPGEVHASVQGVILRDAGHVRDIISQHAAGLSEAPDGRQRSGASGNRKPMTLAPGWRVWTRGYGSLVRVDGDGNGASLETRGGGVLTGTEAYTPGGVLAGILAGYELAGVAIDEHRSDTDIESFLVGTYISRTFGPVQVMAGSVLAKNEIGTTREVAFNGFSDTLTADYRSSTFQLFGEAGYAVESGFVQLTPYAGLALAYLDTDAFGEQGGDAALDVAASSQALGVSTLGLRARRYIAGPWLGEAGLTLDGTVAWRHSFGDVTPGVTSSFAGGDPFDIQGAPLDENTLLLHAGAIFDLSGRLAVSATYHGEFGAATSGNAFQAGLNLKF
ncbi:possible serine protease/outer membrane autotransporter [Stappia aggregata IAM 12614]|uniref:Possible serine protease/outer membrane autotransporter n=2 Tax=Roseibium aggregatum TaxID=187304 RepID=A0P2L9_ROSAI|nr:possible serine protease/outer membrane autotransporter [Stappia aggregata IAM 12614] [Roseibium aggregatum IAM 12614]